MDIKKLGVVVEQKGILPTAKNLDSLAKASDKAAPAVERLSSSLGSFKSINLDSFSAKLQDTTQAIKDVKASTSGMADMAKNIAGLSINLTNIANATERIAGKTSNLDAFTQKIRALKVELEGMKGLSGSLSNLSVGSASRTSGVRATSPSSSSTDADTKAQQRLQQQIERGAMMAGRTKSEYLALRAAQEGITSSAAPFIAQMAEVENRFRTGNMSAKHMAATMRMVPAQFTDIATQLAGGQNPFLIMMQQGGQLRDMFGGFKNMFSAVGPMVFKFITNPFVLAAAAIGGLGYALYNSTRELSEFNKTVAMTNGIVGLSTPMFYDAKNAIAATTNSSSKASEAMLVMSASGKFAAADMVAIGTAAIKMSNLTGKSIEDTLKSMEGLQTKPAETIRALDKQYNFLTSSVYAQITSLEKQGKVTEATTLAVMELKKASEKMSDEVLSKAGWMERAWNGVKNAVIGVKDAMLSVGSDQQNNKLSDLNKQLEVAESNLANLKKTGARSGRVAFAEQSVAEIKAAIVNQKQDLLNEQSLAQVRKESIAAENKKKQARDDFNKSMLDGESAQQKAVKERAKIVADYSQLETKSSEEELFHKTKLAELDKIIAGKPDKAADRIQRRVDLMQREQSEINGLIAAEKAKQSALAESGVGARKVPAHLADLNKWQTQSENKKISEKERQHARDKVIGLERVVLEEDLTISMTERAKAESIASIQSQKNTDLVESANEAYTLERSLIGLTTKERAAATAVYQNEISMKKELLALEKQRQDTEVGSDARAKIEETMVATRAAYAEKNTLIKKTNQLNDEELSWMDNLTTSAKQYRENLGTYNQQVQAGFMSMFSSVEGALTSFVSGTKFSFKDLATSVLKSLAVMFAKIALMKVAMAGIGLLSSMGSAAATPAAATTTTPGFSAGDLGGGIKMANGGMFTSTGLSRFAKGGAFTNSVVSRPTPFKFASGGAFGNGVMGESGPEAIMPLTRGADGKLGVQSSGQGGVQNNVAVNITMNGDGSSNTSTTSDDQKGTKAFGELVAMKVKEVISTEQRPGGLLATR